MPRMRTAENALRKIFTTLLDAVLPPHDDVCTARAITEHDIARLLLPRQTGQDWISALFPYRDPKVQALIRAVKYHAETDALATFGTVLGEYILQTIAERGILGGWEKPIIVPVPASRERSRTRGYNQAARIAEAALPTIGSAAMYAPGLLERENRESQVRVARSKRPENMHGAFSVPAPDTVKDMYIVLIDDVVESGSTMGDARRALRAAGAREVLGIALAH